MKPRIASESKMPSEQKHVVIENDDALDAEAKQDSIQKTRKVSSAPRLPMTLMRLIASFVDNNTIRDFASIDKTMSNGTVIYKRVIDLLEKFIMREDIQQKNYKAFKAVRDYPGSSYQNFVERHKYSDVYYADKFAKKGSAVFPREERLSFLLKTRNSNPKECLRELIQEINVPLYMYLGNLAVHANQLVELPLPDEDPEERRLMLENRGNPEDVRLMLQIRSICYTIFCNVPYHTDPQGWTSPMQVFLGYIQRCLDRNLALTVYDTDSRVVDWWHTKQTSLLVDHLINFGANPHVTLGSVVDVESWKASSAFSLTCKVGYARTIQKLLKSNSTNYPELVSGLIWAVTYKNEQVLQALLENEKVDEALRVVKFDPNASEYVLSDKADYPNPLKVALTCKGQTYTRLIHRLIEAKGDLEPVKERSRVANTGFNAYHLAIKNGHSTVARLLEESGSPLVREPYPTVMDQVVSGVVSAFFPGAPPMKAPSLFNLPETAIRDAAKQVSNFVSLLERHP